ncbi:MAG: DUF1826 domain-containing protein [Pseudomonadota bacterium]
MATLLEPTARLSESPQILAAIRKPDCNLAVWERATSPALGALVKAPREDVRFEARLSGLATRLENELDQAGYAASTERAALIADIVDLAQRYGAIMEESILSVRLAVVTTDSCRKFHADYVKARLITTYVGTGTQWIDGEDAACVARDEPPQRIQTLKAGDVGLFKGKMWTQSPAIHRSPPIADTGETRLMLVLDPPRGP